MFMLVSEFSDTILLVLRLRQYRLTAAPVKRRPYTRKGYTGRMACYDGIPGVHRPVYRLSHDFGEVVVVIVPSYLPAFESAVNTSWAVLHDDGTATTRNGEVDSRAAIRTMESAHLDGCAVVLGRVSVLGDLAPLDDVPPHVISAAGRAVSEIQALHI